MREKFPIMVKMNESLRAHNKASRMVAALSVVLLLLFCALIFAACGNSTETTNPYAAVSDDFRTDYYVGEALRVQGNLKMYSDETTFTEIPITEEMVSGFDTSAAGTIIVKVTYGDFVASVAVTVHPMNVTSITLDAETIPKTLYKDKPFPSTVTFSAVFSDGTIVRGVAVTPSMLGGFDSSYIGTQNVSITYLGATTVFSVQIKEDVMVSIALVNARSTYDLGEPLSVAGARLDVAYESGKVLSTMFTVDMVSGFSTAEGGRQSATVSYRDKTCEYTYFVKKIDAISLVGARSVYAVNDVVTAQGGHLALAYNDGEVRDVAFSADMVSGFSTAKGGDHNATVTYEGLTCDYAYFVQKTPIAFVLNKTSLPATFEKGDSFPEGGTGVVTYDDETSDEVSVSADNAQSFDTQSMGEKTITISVAGCSDEYAYSVLPAIVSATPYGYTAAAMQCSKFDGLGELNLVYENGELESIALNDARVSVQYRSEETGDIAQIVRFRREEVSFTVRIYSEAERNAVARIEISGEFTPIKKGDPINVKNVRVWVVYRYLSPVSVQCDPAWVSFSAPEVIEGDFADVPVTVSCFGTESQSKVHILSEEYAARVTALRATGFKTLYVVGDELSLRYAALSATYGGGYAYEGNISVEESFVSDFDASTAGEKTMTVTYKGFSTSVSYKVISEEDATRVTDLAIYGFDPLLFVGDDIDDIDVSRYSVSLTLGYGLSTVSVPLTLDMLSGGPFDEAGRHTIAVTYQEGTMREFSVTVHPVEERSVVTAIRVPDMIYGYVGTMPDLSLVELEVVYGYGYEVRRISLASAGVSVSPFSTASSGFVRVEVSYEGRSCGAFISFASGGSENILEKIEISEDSRRTFAVGEAFSDVYIIAYYSGNRLPERISVSSGMAPDFSAEEPGNYVITISYGGKPVVYAYAVE